MPRIGTIAPRAMGPHRNTHRRMAWFWVSVAPSAAFTVSRLRTFCPGDARIVVHV